MKRLIIATLVSLLASLPIAAPASIHAVTVKNTTQNCAWITVYWSNALTVWHINTDYGDRPRFIAPGESYRFRFNKGMDQMKVRAEVKANRFCQGSNIKDFESRRDAANYHHEEPSVELRGDSRGYGLDWI